MKFKKKLKKTSIFKESWVDLSTEEKGRILAEFEINGYIPAEQELTNDNYTPSIGDICKRALQYPKIKKLLEPYIRLDHKKRGSVYASLKDSCFRNPNGTAAYKAKRTELLNKETIKGNR